MLNSSLLATSSDAVVSEKTTTNQRLIVLLKDPNFTKTVVAALESAKNHIGIEFEVIELTVYGPVVTGSEPCDNLNIFVQIALPEDVRESAYYCGFKMNEDLGCDRQEAQLFFVHRIQSFLNGGKQKSPQHSYQGLNFDFDVNLETFKDCNEDDPGVQIRFRPHQQIANAHPHFITNSERASWARAALNAMRDGQSPEQIIAAYYKEKMRPWSLDALGETVIELLKDSLHAIAFDAHGENASNMILFESDLSHEDFDALLGLMTAYVNDPQFDEITLRTNAWSHFTEEQAYN